MGQQNQSKMLPWSAAMDEKLVNMRKNPQEYYKKARKENSASVLETWRKHALQKKNR